MKCCSTCLNLMYNKYRQLSCKIKHFGQGFVLLVSYKVQLQNKYTILVSRATEGRLLRHKWIASQEGLQQCVKDARIGTQGPILLWKWKRFLYTVMPLFSSAKWGIVCTSLLAKVGMTFIFICLFIKRFIKIVARDPQQQQIPVNSLMCLFI